MAAVQDVFQEYVNLGHAEAVPPADLEHPQTGSYYACCHQKQQLNHQTQSGVLMHQLRLLPDTL